MFALGTHAAEPGASFTVVPAEISLKGAHGRQALLVTAHHGPQGDTDLTAAATYQSSDPRVAAVNAAGVVMPKGDGSTEIIVRHEDAKRALGDR